MDKKKLTVTNITTKLILPAINQWFEHARTLDKSFIFASNSDEFTFQDKTINNGSPLKTEIQRSDFPTPEQLWHQRASAQRALASNWPRMNRIIKVLNKRFFGIHL